LKYRKEKVAPTIEIKTKTIVSNDIPVPYRPEGSNIHYHLITVRDKGIGFPQEDADRIFQVFTRLHSDREYRGTGIGLSIVRKVMENHGGCCWAEGEAGKGATFFIAVPAMNK
jgi:signal transduction histidine kinase